MWTPATRRQHSRVGLRYETDLTDAEWVLIEPLLPPPPEYGRPRFWPMRAIMNAIFYVLRGGIAWRLLPRDLPPKSTPQHRRDLVRRSHLISPRDLRPRGNVVLARPHLDLLASSGEGASSLCRQGSSFTCRPTDERSSGPPRKC